jgi:hypothetical protein
LGARDASVRGHGSLLHAPWYFRAVGHSKRRSRNLRQLEAGAIAPAASRWCRSAW